MAQGRRWRKWLALGLVLVAIAHVAISVAHLVHNRPRHESVFADFEGDPFADWAAPWMQQLCCPHSAKLTTDIARSGNKSLRFDLKRDDPDIKASKRAELRASSAALGSTQWYALSVYIPDEWIEDPLPVTLAQWHGVPDKLLLEGGRTPPLRLAIVGDEVAVVAHWSAKRVNKAAFGQFSADGYDVLWRAPLVTGQWIDWAVMVRWSYKSDGQIKLWRNGVLVNDRTGPNTYNDSFAPYFKVGLYVPDWSFADKPAIAQSRTVFFDAIRAWENTDMSEISNAWQLGWRPVSLH